MLPPASQRVNKVTLTPPPVFKVTFPIYLIPTFMSSMYFIIFGILLDFTPKMLEIAFQEH
jgi:hypothetical protein